MTVTVLTPPGTGAIATVRVTGTGAWDALRHLFHPAGRRPLPETPPRHCVWFGTLGAGGDEVVLGVEQVTPEPVIDIHCHGGRQVVKWVTNLFPASPVAEDRTESLSRLLTLAPTLRTASILLDQHHGAFHRAVVDYESDLEILPRLASLSPVGRHLITPWQVVLAGSPNVGKSSLINALAGYERSVVAPVAGTTRDVVTTRVAFDGWPVELSDTAGLRETGEELEAAGIARTVARLETADLVVWVLDGSAAEPDSPPADLQERSLVVINKTDEPCSWPPATQSVTRGVLRVSARTGFGLGELIGTIVRRLVPVSPRPGEAVPFTPGLANVVEAAAQVAASGDFVTAGKILAGSLGDSFPSRG